MKEIALWLAALAAQDEAARRAAFEKEFKDKDAAKRVEAVRKLAGAQEEKTLGLLAGALKDAANDVKKAVAETIEASTDGGGVAIAPLCAILVSKKEDPAVRLACAKALGKARYRTQPILAMIETISNISNKERDLFEFGANVTEVLEKYTGEQFGREKRTPELWSNWWDENKEKIKKEDDAKREEYKKSQKK
jgi:hypothetical protein